MRNMNQINRQVRLARRRTFMIQFAKALCFWLFVGLSISAVASAVPKVWFLTFLATETQYQTWFWSWLVAGIAFGLVSAIVWTMVRQGNELQTAIEIDSRFKLKERISSALALTTDQRETKVGQALVRDADSRAETIELREGFALQPERQLLLPVLPALLLLVLVFVPNAVAEQTPPPKPEAVKSDIKVAVEEARKKIQKKIEEMQAKGLKDAAENLESLEKKIDNLSSGLKDHDKKQALVELNNVKKQLAERQQQIGGDSEEMKKQLNQLQRINDGPAKKLSEAINEGDFKEAQEAIRDLLGKLKDGKLSDEEKRKLVKDLAEIAKEINKMADRREQEKQDLKEKIEKANQEGDLEKAAQLQQQLEKMEKQDQQIQKMKDMAEKMQNCANCMKQGNGQPKQGQQGQPNAAQQGNQPSDAEMQQAIEALEDMEGMMDQLQDEMEELEDLEDIMKEIEFAKNDCQGCEGNQNGEPKWQDWAKGGGRGGGKRDKQETETGSYKSRVKGKLQQGETVVTGNADGNNITGKSISEVREIAKASISKKSDPLENQKLPRSQREHAREYFENLRGN